MTFGWSEVTRGEMTVKPGDIQHTDVTSELVIDVLQCCSDQLNDGNDKRPEGQWTSMVPSERGRERESSGKFDCSITSPTRYDLGSSPEPGVTCGFSLLFVLVLDPRVFSLPYPIRHGNSGGQRAITWRCSWQRELSATSIWTIFNSGSKVTRS